MFAKPVHLKAGDRFAIVLSAAGDCGVFQGPTGNPYPGGDAFYDARPNRPGIWLLLSGGRADLAFQTLVLPDP